MILILFSVPTRWSLPLIVLPQHSVRSCCLVCDELEHTIYNKCMVLFCFKTGSQNLCTLETRSIYEVIRTLCKNVNLYKCVWMWRADYFDLRVQHYLLMIICFFKQLESNTSFAISSLWAPWLNVAEKWDLRKFSKPWTMLESGPFMIKWSFQL